MTRKITHTIDLVGKRNSSTNVITQRVNLLTNPTKSSPIEQAKYVNIYVDHVGDIGDNINILVETSPDGVNYYPLITVEDTSSLAIIRNRFFRYTTTSTSDKFSLPINVQDAYMKVSFSGTGTIYSSFKFID